MQHAKPRFPPGLGVAVAVVSVSFAAPLFRLADAHAVTASFWRLAFAVVLLLPFTGRAWRLWASYSGRDWLLIAATGAALALHFALWVQALFLTTIAAATALVTLQAVLVALGGHLFLRDRLDRRAWLGVAVAVAGALALAYFDSRDGLVWSRRALLGDAFALAAGVGSAIYMLVGRRLRATRGLVEYVVPIYAAAALALLAVIGLVALVAGVSTAPPAWWSELHGATLRTGLSAGQFGAFVLLAAVPMLGGHTMANWSLRYLPAHTVAAWILLEPVGAALLGWAFLDEVPELGVVAGGLVILAGAWLTVPRTTEPAAEPAG